MQLILYFYLHKDKRGETTAEILYCTIRNKVTKPCNGVQYENATDNVQEMSMGMPVGTTIWIR